MAATLERILMLLKESGKSDKEFLSDLGFGKSTLSEWRSGKITSYTKHIDKIADYFGVSTDYLLCKTDDRKPAKKGNMSEDELDLQLLRAFNPLSIQEKQLAIRMVRSIRESDVF